MANSTAACIRKDNWNGRYFGVLFFIVLICMKSTSRLGSTSQRCIRSEVESEMYDDAYHARKASYRRPVSGGVMMCAGACVSFFSVMNADV